MRRGLVGCWGLAAVGSACVAAPSLEPTSESVAGAEGDDAGDAEASESDGGWSDAGGDLPPPGASFAGVVTLDGSGARFTPCSGPVAIEAPLFGIPALENAGACLLPLRLEFFGHFVDGPSPAYEVLTISGGPCRAGSCDAPPTWTECRAIPADAGGPPWFEALCTTPGGCGFGCATADSTACATGDKCTLATCDGERYAACRAAGTAPLGDGCFGDPDTGLDSCAAGGVCRGGVCRALCTVGEPAACGVDEQCVDLGVPVGVCARACDPIAPDCGPLETCTLVGGTSFCLGD